MRSIYKTGFSPRAILKALSPQQDMCTLCLVIWSSPDLTSFLLCFPFSFFLLEKIPLSVPIAQSFLPPTRTFPVWEGSFNQLLQLISFFEIHLLEAASISRKYLNYFNKIVCQSFVLKHKTTTTILSFTIVKFTFTTSGVITSPPPVIGHRPDVCFP